MRLIFVDANAREGESFAGFPVLSQIPVDLTEEWRVFPAAGDNIIRQQQCSDPPLPLTRLIAPTSSIGVEALIGQGSLVAHHAHVGPAARIGVGVILNTGSIVEHDCRVDDFTHVSVHATIAGRSKIGQRCMIGAGATVIDGIAICDDVVIGAGAAVIKTIAEPGIYVGVPARKII